MSQEVIRELDALNVTMNGGSTLLNIVLALVMFGVALGIKPATFVDIIAAIGQPELNLPQLGIA